MALSDFPISPITGLHTFPKGPTGWNEALDANNEKMFSSLMNMAKRCFRYKVQTKGLTWSRILQFSTGGNLVGTQFLVGVLFTRNAVVCNVTLLANSLCDDGGIVQLSDAQYVHLANVNCSFRLVTESGGGGWFEFYDNCNNAANVNQIIDVTVIPIGWDGRGGFTPITDFTDGTVIPSGYVEQALFNYRPSGGGIAGKFKSLSDFLPVTDKTYNLGAPETRWDKTYSALTVSNNVALNSIPITVPMATESLVLSMMNHQYGEIRKVFISLSSGEYAGAGSYNLAYNVAARSSNKLIAELEKDIELTDGGVTAIKGAVEIRFALNGSATDVFIKNNRTSGSVYATAGFIGISNAL